jgi:RNA-directed DNA polymerase
LDVDHVIPTEMGGHDRYDNWQLLHQHCHHRKAAQDRQFRQSAVLLTKAN